MKRLLCTLALAGALAHSTAVYAMTFDYQAGVVHETDAFASYATTGADMAGMGVHVVYTDGTVYDATWQKLSTGFGGVLTDVNRPFQVTAGNTGDGTYSWMLYNASQTNFIRSISFDGQPGNTVFDVSFPFGAWAGFNFVGTPGTSTGRELDLASVYRNLYDGIAITYSDAVALAGAEPVGDVFRRMTIDFSPRVPLYSIIEFQQDTDSLAFGSVLAPVASASNSVPERGATILLFIAALVLLMTAKRRVLPFIGVHGGR